ncbi:retention module-containing protein [Denitromonas sp.]|uniref:retention module-containing protein n=1 Tax=Denitromonas sp. TaxID=2734609 RepID=UPI002AFE8F63|nr:retention module-containing protein [Denitromonas sp.]
MAINQPVATVVAVTGEAYARNAEGVLRALKAGDALYEGEVVITRNGGRVELATSDGQLLEVLPDETVAITAELSDTTRPTPQEAAVGDATIDRVVQALEQGGDIDDALEAPAAGLAGGAGGEGNSFVRLLRITEGVDPLSFEFGTAQPAVPFDFDGGIGDDTDDAVPEVVGTLSISGPANVIEGESATYTVSVDRAPTSDLIVNIVTGHITTSDGDVNLITTSVTIPAGATSATFTVSTIDDAYADSGEQFSVGIAGASGGGYDRIVVGGGQAITTILDQTGSDDPPGAEDTATVSLSGPSTVTEGGDASYTVSVDHAPAADLTLNITLTHIDTVSGDIVSVPATVTIPAGSTSAVFNVSTFDDNVHESAENYSISIGLPATPGGGFENLVLGSSSVVTTTIVDNDTPSLSIDDVTVNEAAGTATFTVTLSNPSAGTVTVDYGNADGTAVAGASGSGDYDTVGGTLSFAPGVTTQTITVNINNDTIYEISEQFAIDLSNPTGGAVIGDGQGIGTIRDDGTGGPPGTDNDIPAVSISGPVLVNEAAGTLTYTVSLTNPSDHPVTVDVATANGTAQAGSDYTALSQSLTFAPGVTSQTVTVNIVNDSPAVYEGAENYTVALSNVGGAVIGTGSVTTTIVDDGTGGPPGGDDDRPVISIVGPAEVNEGAGTITYTLNLSNPSTAPVSVTVDTMDAGATAGSDYSPIASQVVTFAPGATSATVTVNIVNDSVFEGAEAYQVNLSAPTGGASIGTGSVTTTIRDDGTGGPPGTDDDTPVISITGPAVVNEAAGTVTYTVSLSNPSTSAVTVGYASADGTAIAGAPGAGDYDAVSGTLTFAPGVTSQTITLTINNDTTYERAEDYSLSLAGPVGATIGTGNVTTVIRDDGTAGDPPTTGNDDDRPAFSINDVTVNEGAGTATFTVTLSNPSALNTTVDFATADGSALSGADYTGTGGTLSFAPGVTSQTVTVAILNDAVYEGSEQFVVNLSNATADATIADAQGVGTIVDDGTGGPPGSDNDIPTLSVSSPTVTEGTDPHAVFTVSLSNPSVQDVSVSLALADVSATTPADYGAGLEVFVGGAWVAATNATIPAGSTSVQVRTPIANDDLAEGNETFTLAATVTGGSTTNPSATGTATIVDNDTPSFRIDDVTVNEAAGTATFTVTLSNPSASTVTVDYASANGTAVAGAPGAGDYDTVGGTLSFAPGVTTQTITVNINNDTIYEISEQFAIDLSNPTGGAVIGDGQGIGTIRDDGTGGPPGTDNDIPAVSISGPVLVNEAAGTLTYTVSLTNPSDHPVTVDVATANGTAQAGSDYTALSQSLTFAPGVTSQTVTVNIVNDSPAVYEGAENYTVALSNVGGAVIGTGSVTTTIVDDGTGGPPGGDDDRPVISIVGPAEVNEGAGTITYTLNLSNPSTAPVSVTVDTMDAGATAGSDYSPIASQVVTFAPGATSATVTVNIVNDSVFEGAEAYQVNLSAPTGGASIGTGSVTTTIRDDGTGGPPGTDDDTPVISITGPAVVNEAAGTVTYTVSLSNPSTSAVTVGYASADGTAIAGAPGAGDYDAVSGTLTFAPGVTSQTITLTINNDTTYERAEDYSLSLAGPVGATIGTGNVTTVIRDDGTAGDPPTTGNDDDRPAFSINDVTVNEGAGTATFTVTLSNPSALNTTVDFATADGSALSGADYTGTGGTLSFAPGVTSQTVTVAILNDAVYEGSEQFVVNLSNATADATIADAQGVGTIVDDGTGGPPGSDNDIPTLSVSSPTVTEGTDPHAVFTVSLSNPSVQDVSVSLALADVSATTPADYGAGLEVFVGGAWVAATNATIPAGSTSVQVRTPIANDDLAEGNETFTLAATVTGGSTTNPSATGTATIVDNDTPSFRIDDVTVNEAAGTATFTVTLSNPSASTVTVDYASANGTAVAGAPGAGDYDTVGGTLSFAPGVTTQTITVNINNDTIYEISEQFAIDLSNPTGGAVIGDGQGIGTIRDDGTGGPPGTDNDIPAVSISGPVLVNEAAGTLTYTVSLTNPSDHPVTVDVATANGTAQAGSDYTALSQSLTFAPGVTSQTVTVNIVNDSPAVYEGAENYTVALSNVGGAVIGTGSVTTTIVDDGTGGPGGDDDRPVISIVGPAEVNEGAGTITYTLNLSNPSTNAVSVTVDTADAGATAGSDYSPIASQVVTFAPGATSATVTVNIVNDSVFEGAEAYQVNLSAPTGGASIGTGSVTTTIRDDGTGGPPGTDDDTPVISITGPAVVNEAAGTVTYTVSLSNPSTSAVTVGYASADGTAIAGAPGAGDYDAVSGTLTFAPGVTSQTITLTINNDTTYERAEDYSLSLAGPVGATIGTGNVTTVIRDDGTAGDPPTTGNDDDRPAFSINDVTVNEGAGTATFTVTLSNPSALNTTVDFATADGSALSGADYTGTGGTLSFAPGVTSQTVTVAILNDAVYEGSEQFVVNLSNATADATIADAQGVGTIVDDGTGGPPGSDNDIPTLSVSSPTVTEGTDPHAVFTVSLSNPSVQDVSVSLALADVSATTPADYGAGLEVFVGGAWVAATNATIPAGSTSVQVRTPIANDDLAEGNETFTLAATVTGGSTTNPSATGTATIVDNDTPSFRIDDVTVNEAAGTATFTVTLSNPSASTVTVDYASANGTAVAGAPGAGDYDTVGGTLSFAPGVTTQTITVNINNDTIYEISEQFAIDLSNPTGGAVIGDGQGIGTIRDDGTGGPPGTDNDIPAVSISGPVLVNEAAGTLTYTVSLTNPSDHPVTVDVATANGTAQAGSDYTALSQSLTFAPGVTSQTVTVNIVNDSPAVYEGAENYTVALSNVGGAVIGTGSVTTTIVDDGTGGPPGGDDDRPTLSIDNTSVDEGGYAIFTAALSNASVTPVTFTTALASGTAVLGTDTSAASTLQYFNGSSWVSASGGVTIPAGSTTVQLRLQTTNDMRDEPDEDFTLTGTVTSGNTRNLTAQGTATILDNDTTPTVGSAAAAVSEEGLAGGNPDTAGVSDTTNSPIFSGVMPVADVDGNALTVTLTAPTTSLSSNGVAVTWTGGGTQTLIGSAGGSEVIRVQINNTGAYTVTLSQPLDHPMANAEDVLNLNVGVTASDGVQSGSGVLTIQVEDDSPTTVTTVAKVQVPVDQIVIQNLQAGWRNAVFDNYSSQYTRLQNTDSDALVDKVSWGRPASGSGQSGYTLVDNTAFTSATGTEVQAGQSIKLADFQHLNWPIYSGYATLDQVTLTLSLDVVINGVSNTISFDVLVDHNETPNSGADPRDIISLPSQTVTVTIGNQDYDIQLDGFRDGSGNIVNTIYTNENATNDFEIMGSIQSTDPVPSVSGNVFGDAGADGSVAGVVWGSTTSAYGTLTANADGSYAFVVDRAVKDGLSAGESLSETFSYTITDKDGDTTTGSLTIQIGGYQNIDGTAGADTLVGTAADEYLSGYAGNDDISGGAGDDVLVGGQGDDLLAGGLGADVFRWELGDAGTAGNPARDTVIGFDTTANSDSLDLRDLLVGESQGVDQLGNLESYLHFEVSGSNTVVHVSSTGGFAGGYNPSATDQSITLNGVDLSLGGTLGSDQQVIQDLLSKGKLITD